MRPTTRMRAMDKVTFFLNRACKNMMDSVTFFRMENVHAHV